MRLYSVFPVRSVCAILSLAAIGRLAPAATTDSASLQPVVVELFTSEGCSSCPPADAFLRTLDQSQPVPGALVITLSEHVDYWDRLGWKDPFSSPAYSHRQTDYSHRFHLDGVYTPQVVIDGTSEVVGSDARRIQEEIRRSARTAKPRMRISAIFKNAQGSPAVRVEVEPSEKSTLRAASRLRVALAENVVVTNVLRGENSGRKLEHVSVVRALVDHGALDPAKASTTEVTLTGELKEWKGKRIVAFIQDSQAGPIRGAAVARLPVDIQ